MAKLIGKKPKRHQILTEWNNTQVDYQYEEQCIHQLFEQQVEKTPEAVAVVFAEQKLTYQELNNRANQLAHFLSAKGISKGVHVPVLMDRSLELVIALLAIMKTGATFVPLDIYWPVERLQQIFSELNSKVILIN